MVVAEQPLRVDLVAQRREVTEVRVHGGEVLGVAGVQLAPVRAAPVGGHQLLHLGEVALVGGAPVEVDGDVRAVAAARGGQPEVVGGREAHLDGEADLPARALHQRLELAQDGRDLLARHRVLHLGEPHRARAGEHLVREVGVRPLGPRAGRDGGDRRDGLREPPADPAGALPDRVGEELVVQPGLEPGQRRGRPLAAVVALGGAAVGVREPVELEVLVDGRQVVQPAEHLVEAHRLLVGGEQEGRLDTEGDRADHPEGAEAQPGALEQLGVLGRRAALHAAVGEHDLQRPDLRGQRA